MKIVALLAVRNEALFIRRCVEHLLEQGIKVWVIDNESDDGTPEILAEYVGRGVLGIETLPFYGIFDLRRQLRAKEQLAQRIDADWFIHHDADEIREASSSYASLHDGIAALDQAGYNAIDFNEFVFLPTDECEGFEHHDYVQTMRYYYPFRPGALRRVNAWKNTGQPVDLTASGGHQVCFAGRHIAPKKFVLRHYILLSREHAVAKYGKRVYAIDEVRKGWSRDRAAFNPADYFPLPHRRSLKRLGPEDLLDESNPEYDHPFLKQGQIG